MNRVAAAASIALLATCSPSQAQLPSLAQVPPPNTGAPFTAIETRTSTYAEKGLVVVQTSTIARRSDGSSFWRLDLRTWNGAVSPKHFQPTAIIYDNRRHLLTALDLSANLYLSAKKTLSPPRNVPALAASSSFASFNTPAPPPTVNLGVHKIDGLDAIGTLVNYSDGSSFEKWLSPALSIPLQSKSYRISPREDSVTSVTQVTLGEPDPTLFQIPAGFLPAPPSKH